MLPPYSVSPAPESSRRFGSRPRSCLGKKISFCWIPGRGPAPAGHFRTMIAQTQNGALVIINLWKPGSEVHKDDLCPAREEWPVGQTIEQGPYQRRGRAAKCVPGCWGDPSWMQPQQQINTKLTHTPWKHLEKVNREKRTRVLISIKAVHPNYTSLSSLICNPNLSHSHHKQGVTFSV